MQLVEQHVIDRKDSRFAAIDAAAFKSKNLYNAALYEMRQAFIHEGVYLDYREMDKRMQSHEAYKALPAKVSQQVLMLLDKNWKSFFESRKAYEQDPSTFTGRPKLPQYKHKQEGRNMLVYTIQAISRKGLKQGLLQPSMLPISVKTKQRHIDQVRLVPKKGYYVMEVVYSKDPIQATVDPSFCVALDLGVTNLAAIASNREGFVPRLVNGRPIKAWNQWYNKRMKALKKKLPKEDRSRVTKQMERITDTRNRRDARFIEMITYKAALVGIQVEVTEESYTSKASFLDLDTIPNYTPNDEEKHIFSGKRIGRRNRLYRAKDGRVICADVNGAYNILRKSRPDAFAKGVAGYVVHPLRLAVQIKHMCGVYTTPRFWNYD